MPAAPPPPPGAAHGRRLLLQSAVTLLAGAALVALFLRAAGLRSTLEVLAGTRWSLVAAATAVLALQIPVLGLRWWLALRLSGQRVPPLVMIRVNTASNLVNLLLPGHFGEASASWWLGRTVGVDAVPAFSALIACKAVGSMVNALGAVLLLPLVWSALAGQALGLALAFGSAAAVGVGGLALVHPQLGGALGHLVGVVLGSATRLLAMPFRGAAGALELAESVEERWGALWGRLRGSIAGFLRRPRILLPIVALSVVKVLLVAASFGLTFAALGLELGTARVAFTSILNDLGRFVFVHVPLNLGSQEAVIYGALLAYAVPGSKALAAALLYKIVTVGEALVSALVVLALAPFHPRR